MEVTIDSDLESVELAECGSRRKRKQKTSRMKENRKNLKSLDLITKNYLFLAIIQINSVMLKKYLMK